MSRRSDVSPSIFIYKQFSEVIGSATDSFFLSFLMWYQNQAVFYDGETMIVYLSKEKRDFYDQTMSSLLVNQEKAKHVFRKVRRSDTLFGSSWNHGDTVVAWGDKHKLTKW